MKGKILVILSLILVIGCSFNKTNTHQEKKTAVLKEADLSWTLNRNGVQDDVKIAKATVSQTLVSDEIRCISAGASSVWVGTDRGVSVYHKGRSQWTSLNRENGLVSDNVTAIAVDGQLVWIGTRLGVSRYDVAKKTFKTFQRRDGLGNNNITAVAVDGNYVWFGTDNGISRLDKATGAWALKRDKGEEEKLNKITSIVVETDYIWIGTQGGLQRYEKAKDSWNTYTENDGLVQNYIRCIAVSSDSVWVGTEKSGVSQYSKTDQSFIKSYAKTDILSSNFIQAIAVDGSNIWFGSSDYGIRRYLTTVDTWFSYTTAQGLASDHITWITIDGNDIWMGTYEYGLSRYDKVANTWISYRKKDTLVSNHIKALATQGSYVWIGTTEGLSRYDPIKREWKNYTKADGLVTNYITSLATAPTNHVENLPILGIPQSGTDEDGNEILWAGTPLGLGKFEPTSKKWRFYTKADGFDTLRTQPKGLADNFITNIGVEEHQIWVATKKGLSVLKIARDTWRTYLADKWITSVLPKNGEVWVGTTDGLYKLNPKEDKFEAIPSVKNYVNTIAEYSGKLLVGTRGGLFIVGESELNIEHLTIFWVGKSGLTKSIVFWVGDTGFAKQRACGATIKDGLPNNNIRVIAPDGDSIWLGTPKGLARLNFKRDIQIFTIRSSGLLHDNIQSILVKNEKIWIGTVAGLSSYDKQNNQWENYKPYPTTQVLREDNINWIQEDERNLWALNWSESPNGAIMKFDKDTQTWIKYTKEEIPISDEVPWLTEVRRMAIDGDDVWFATNGGVLRYNKESDTWTHFTKSSGLPGHRALFVEVDAPLKVWVAFHGGVASYYDKNSGIWQTLQVTRAGVGTNIDAIAFTEKYVWFSTGNTGIRRYDRETKEWTSYTEAQGMASRRGPWLVADGRDIWTGGWGAYSWISDRGTGGVSKYDASTDSWSIYDKSKGLLASGMEYGQISNNYIWCFGRGGINRYDKRTKTWISLTQSDGLPDWSVNAVIEDGNILWVGTGGKGVCKYSFASNAWTAFTKEDGLADDGINPYALIVDDQYARSNARLRLSVWAGTKQGLSRYDKAKKRWISFTKPQTLQSRRVLTVAVDSRYVWCGTHRGLSRYDKRYDTWKNFQKEEEEQRPPWEQQQQEKEKEKKENELVDNNVVALSVDERYVWIATEGGVGRYDKIANRFEAYTEENKLPSADVRTIGESQSDVWIGTANGVSKHSILSDDPNAWETYNAAIEIEPMIFDKQYAQSLVHDDVRCLAVDDNRIWIGTKTGVSLYDIKKGLWQTFTQKDGLASSEVSCIAVDGDIIWFGSGRGATSYNAKTQKWQTYHKTKVAEVAITSGEANTVNGGLASNHITSIAVNKEQVWFGTFDKGVTILDKASLKWRTLTIMDGLPHNGILAIVMDGDNVWIGTHGGLVRYSISAETSTVYTEQFDLDGI